MEEEKLNKIEEEYDLNHIMENDNKFYYHLSSETIAPLPSLPLLQTLSQ